MRTTGLYVTTTVTEEAVSAFIPNPLPPANPKLCLNESIRMALRNTENALAALELAGEMVPSVDWFIYAFVRKEAVTSSQIEGTQATLMDLLKFEAEDKTESADVEEVCNHIEALQFARSQLRKANGLPISMRLLNEAHKCLMKGVRGADKQPGEVRRSQNWIGGSKPGNANFVPPPPEVLTKCLADFEKYIHAKDDLQPLVKVALLHAQFETIHPYLDGNGRLGRLLITLLLEHWGLLSQPLLYLSLFFKRNRLDYYDHLSAIRVNGDWESWVSFFLQGTNEIGREATSLARSLFGLVTEDRARLLQSSISSVMALRLFEILPMHPILTMPKTVKLLSTTKPTAIKAISVLEKLNILSENSGRKRDRTFAYTAYLKKLEVGTEL